jgi:hypothetical protein
VLSWFAECLAFYLMIHGFPDGGQASVTLSTFIYAVMTVAGALAFVPGGLGVTEGGMALLLAELGHDVALERGGRHADHSGPDAVVCGAARGAGAARFFRDVGMSQVSLDQVTASPLSREIAGNSSSFSIRMCSCSSTSSVRKPPYSERIPSLAAVGG